MKRLLLLVLLFTGVSFAQRVNPSQLRAPTGTASVTQFLICVPSGTCAWAQSGVVPNPQTGTSYTIVGTDRMKYLTFSNGSAIAVTLPQAGTSGFANNYVFVACDIGAGTATITPTTSTISSSNGSAYTAAAATLALTTGQCAWVYSDNTNYFAIVRAAGGATINATNNVIPRRSSATAFVDSAFTDDGTNVTSSRNLILPAGSSSAASLQITGSANTGIYARAATALDFTANGTPSLEVLGSVVRFGSSVIGFNSTDATAASDVSLSRETIGGVPALAVGTGSANSSGLLVMKAQFSDTNCSAAGTAANPSVASCGSAMAGAFSCATNASTGTCQINTTAVNANSDIIIVPSAADGSRLSVTCNTTADAPTGPRLLSKNAGVSFTINLGTVVTNPTCYEYYIIN